MRCFLAELLVQTELLVEAADTTAGIEHLLLTGEEGVALSANFHADVLLGRASGIDSTTSAADRGLLVIRMDSVLHDLIHPFLKFHRLNTIGTHTLLRTT